MLSLLTIHFFMNLALSVLQIILHIIKTDIHGFAALSGSVDGSTLAIMVATYYAPNFEKVGRAYCFRLVCLCVCVSVCVCVNF